ncbi:flagellar hook-length control protein FliK [Caloramator sp. ALD01]|uniref:flagellar hook-length control protein FliK n=1 Tax=Caloramator sp. ALD01 TaxID=1031288 RepID=UPI000424552C|nr:flagellar hook-length control protein FliK [Caloramator sp. ALD01]
MKIEALEKLLNNYSNNNKKLYEGSTINAKIIALEDNKGAIKLYDGTIIPAIFVSEDIEKGNQFLKFKIEKVEENQVILRLIGDSKEKPSYSNLKSISDNLSIPFNRVEEIVNSLIKFNLPATDENVLTLFNSLKSLEALKTLKDEDIKNIFKNFLNLEISEEDLSFVKNQIHDLENIDIDFLTFLLENKIDISIKNLLNTKKVLNENDFINFIIQKLNQNHSLNKVYTLENIFEEILKNTEVLKNNADFIEKFDIINLLSKNYNFYFFNTSVNDNVYKNSIIIKNKYKRVIDINDVKLYIKVDTENIGTIENYIHKHNDNIIINIKCDKKYIDYIKANLKILKESLNQIGLNLINSSVEEIKTPHKDIINFFNDFIINELDVKV